MPPSKDYSRIMAADQSRNIAQLELQALLEVTQAINQNLPEVNLYKIFRFTLLANLNIERIGLYAPHESGDWENKISVGGEQQFKHADLVPFLDINKITPLQGCPFLAATYQFVIPVPHKNQLLALVFIKLNVNNDKEREETLRFVQLVANVLMVAIENKKLVRDQIKREARRESMRKELDIARLVQTNLFPQALPREGACICEATYLPHDEVGGDYYDFICLDDGKFLFCIADVSGKGIPAALLMSNFQASLRTLARRAVDLNDLIAELNFQLKQNAKAEHFITVFIGVYNPQDAGLEYINAGHNPPLLVTLEGTIKQLEAGTTVLGFFDPLPFMEIGRIEAVAGSLLFAYTDGLVEVMNQQEEMYGLERVQAFIRQNATEALPDLHQGILEELRAYKKEGPFGDDLTLLSCRFGS